MRRLVSSKALDIKVTGLIVGGHFFWFDTAAG